MPARPLCTLHGRPERWRGWTSRSKALETRSRCSEQACQGHPHPSSEALSRPQTERRRHPLSERPPARLFAFRFDRDRVSLCSESSSVAKVSDAGTVTHAPPGQGESEFCAQATSETDGSACASTRLPRPRQLASLPTLPAAPDGGEVGSFSSPVTGLPLWRAPRHSVST